MSDKAADKDKLIVGIDLGTSRSAISASNGKKKWVESYVGWPKDFIAKKVVGKPVLFGEEALHNRLSLEIFRPLERGVIKEGTTRDEEAVKELIPSSSWSSPRPMRRRAPWSGCRRSPSKSTAWPSSVPSRSTPSPSWWYPSPSPWLTASGC